MLDPYPFGVDRISLLLKGIPGVKGHCGLETRPWKGGQTLPQMFDAGEFGYGSVHSRNFSFGRLIGRFFRWRPRLILLETKRVKL